MARRSADDDDGNDELPADEPCTGGRRVGRRRYLELAGLAAAAATGAGAATGGAAAAEYRTVTVPAGGRESFHVGSGETLANLLVDVTADGADVQFSASGDDWTVRNVGVKGSFDAGRGGGSSNVLNVEGNGRVENVYLGDGHVDGVRRGAIGCGPSHAGHVELRNVHVQGWSGNAVYAAGPGRQNPPGKTDGQGGTLAFRNCYFANNNIAHLRIASGGSVVEGCVFTNTNDVPPHPNTSGGASGVVNSRGIYTGYGDPGQTIEVRDCHFDLTAENTNGAASAVVSGTHSTYGELTTVRVVDSEVRGDLVGEQVVTENVGSDPDTAIPSGTPGSAEAAAGGGAAGAGGAGGGGGASGGGSASGDAGGTRSTSTGDAAGGSEPAEGGATTTESPLDEDAADTVSVGDDS